MAKKLQKKRTKTPAFRNAKVITPVIPAQKIAPETGFTTKVPGKTTLVLTEAEKFTYVKYDIKRSLIIGAGIFALMAILYFFLR